MVCCQLFSELFCSDAIRSACKPYFVCPPMICLYLCVLLLCWALFLNKKNSTSGPLV